MGKEVKVKFVNCMKKQFRVTQELLGDSIKLVEADDPDYVIYSVFDTPYRHYEYDNCIKIFLASEGVVPDFNACDYAIGEYPMQVGNRYFCKPYIAPKSVEEFTGDVDDSLLDRKFCNFIYSNANNGNGAVLRKEFCQELMKYRGVDCPGQVLNNMKNAIEPREGKWAEGKHKFIKDYKFTITFENTDTPGMVSEKILDAFICKSVPIYWGPKEVYDIYNKEAFIDCTGLTIQEMIQKVTEIDQNDELYMKLLRANPLNPNFNLNWEQDMRDFLIDILLGNKPRCNRDPLKRDPGARAGRELLDIEKHLWFKLYRANKELGQKISKAIRKVR